MAFTTKNLLRRSRGLSFLKGLTLFFLGASIVILMANALEISTSVFRFVQYTKQIILTSNGSASGVTGIFLDGPSGDAYFNGNVHIADNKYLLIGGGGTADYFKIYQNTDANIDFKPNLYFKSNGSTKMTFTSGGNLGIGTSTPKANFQVEGTMKVLSNISNGGPGKSLYTGLTSVASGFLYFPSGYTIFSGNNGLDTDSIWYLSCIKGTGFVLNGFTGSGMGDGAEYVSLLGAKSATLTYNLRAQETFQIDTCSLSGAACTLKCDTMLVYKQFYGKDDVETVQGGMNLRNEFIEMADIPR